MGAIFAKLPILRILRAFQDGKGKASLGFDEALCLERTGKQTTVPRPMPVS